MNGINPIFTKVISWKIHLRNKKNPYILINNCLMHPDVNWFYFQIKVSWPNQEVFRFLRKWWGGRQFILLFTFSLMATLTPSFHHLCSGLGSISPASLNEMIWKWLAIFFSDQYSLAKPDWLQYYLVLHDNLFMVCNFVVNLLNILNKLPQQKSFYFDIYLNMIV